MCSANDNDRVVSVIRPWLPRAHFIDRFAYFLGEVNALHPFREGNGRAQRQLFRQVAPHAGWSLDVDAMDPVENVEASIIRVAERPLRNTAVARYAPVAKRDAR